MEAHQLDDLGMVCGQIWEEVAHSPGVTGISVKTGWSDDLIRLEVEGRAPADAISDQDSGWSSALTRVVVVKLTRSVTLHRSQGTIRIEADFPATKMGPSSF